MFLKTMESNMIKIAPGLQAQIEAEAKEMEVAGQNERQFVVSNTSAKLWLVRINTPEAKRRMADGASILSDMMTIGTAQFFLARR